MQRCKFSKKTATIKIKPVNLELKNTSEIKNSLDGLDSRMDMAENVTELKYKPIKLSKLKKRKRLERWGNRAPEIYEIKQKVIILMSLVSQRTRERRLVQK